MEVDGIACEIVHVDLGGVHLDDGPVLSITLAATADADGRREDDMTQNAALRGGPASRNVLVKEFEHFHRLNRLVQLDLDPLVLLVRCRVVHPLSCPNTLLLIVLGDNCFAFHLDLNRFETLFECCIAKERDVITALVVDLMLEVLVLAPVWREDDVASGNEQPRGIHALGNEEAAGTLSSRRRLGTDEETECSGRGFADIYGGVGRKGVKSLRPAERVTTDLVISTLTSPISHSTRSSWHLEATTTP